jgi:hypothetical protein
MESKTSLGAGVRPLQGGGGIFKSAAVAVLRLERRLMTTGDITKRAVSCLLCKGYTGSSTPPLSCRVALEKALINCQGRTPDATMASALYTDIKRKLDQSVFTRWDSAFQQCVEKPSTPLRPKYQIACDSRLK